MAFLAFSILRTHVDVIECVAKLFKMYQKLIDAEKCSHHLSEMEPLDMVSKPKRMRKKND